MSEGNKLTAAAPEAAHQEGGHAPTPAEPIASPTHHASLRSSARHTRTYTPGNDTAAGAASQIRTADAASAAAALAAASTDAAESAATLPDPALQELPAPADAALSADLPADENLAPEAGSVTPPGDPSQPPLSAQSPPFASADVLQDSNNPLSAPDTAAVSDPIPLSETESAAQNPSAAPEESAVLTQDSAQQPAPASLSPAGTPEAAQPAAEPAAATEHLTTPPEEPSAAPESHAAEHLSDATEPDSDDLLLEPQTSSSPMPLQDITSHLAKQPLPKKKLWQRSAQNKSRNWPGTDDEESSLRARFSALLHTLQIHPNTLKTVTRPYLCPFLLTLGVYLLAVINSSIYHGHFTLKLTQSAVLFAIVCGFGSVWIRRSMIDARLHGKVFGLLSFALIILCLLIPAAGIAYVYQHYLELAPFGPSLRTVIFGISVFFALFFFRALINLVLPNHYLDIGLRHAIAAILCIILALLGAILCHPLLYQAPLSADTFKLLEQTDLAEAIEFFFEYWVFFIPIVVLAFCHCIFFKGLRLFRDRGRYDFVNTFFIDFVLLILAAGSCIFSAHNYLYEVQVSMEHLQHEEPVASRHLSIPRQQLDSITRPLNGVYLLVIGESLHRKHMSGYGYRRKTTPFLDLMLSEMPYNIVKFERPYANDYHTVASLKRALTAANLYNDVQFDTSPSLIEAVKANGFDTYWISNQNRYAWADTELSFIAAQADMSVFISDDLRTIKTPYDEGVLPYLDEIRNMQNGLIVVHLYGNHYRFASRYPKRFEIYKGHKRVDYYDNSVIYNDYVVKRIYEMFKENSNFNALLFFADHALGADDELKYDLHHPFGSEIPMYAILSEKFMKEISPSKFNALRENAKSPITNDLVYNTMLSLMNITPASYEDYNDPLSERYDGDPDRFRTAGGQDSILPP